MNKNGWMRLLGVWCLALAGAMATAAEPAAEKDPMQDLPWVKGPTQVELGSKAKLKLAQGLGFLAEKDSAPFFELTGNLPSEGESILMANGWFAVFGYDDVGYVKDDEKLDADALLKELKSSDAPANEERRKRGLSELHTEGWAVPPHYDSETKHLEWGLKLRSQDSPEPIINYTVRLLGRSGFENVVLVTSPETLGQDVRALKVVLQGFDFNSGEKYSEFKAGDHVAEFGLGALVLGGAAAALAKSGFWKTLLVALAAGWKLVLGAGIAVVAGVARLFGRRNRT